MIALKVNGKPVELGAPTPLTDYVGRLGIDPRAIAVEVNGDILQRDAYGECVLQDGDVVEIVRMVGGGAQRPGAVERAGQALRHSGADEFGPPAGSYLFERDPAGKKGDPR